ncbi:MAG: DUF2442 domain-containing protein [Chitinophagaceae bacterium]|nr:DUF2442 domain-containing protein [Chitinophagaceae bacterium]
MFPKVISVSALKDYRIRVKFDDGVEGIYDLSHLSGKGVFKSWDKNDNFSKVEINPESGAITWPEGLDIDSIEVYASIKGIQVNELTQRMKSHA